jgi:hypothetical protein
LLTATPSFGASAARQAYVWEAKNLAKLEASLIKSGAKSEDIARALNEARNALKLKYRGGLFKSLKTPSYESLVQQGKNDQLIIEGAKKTNDAVNKILTAK